MLKSIFLAFGRTHAPAMPHIDITPEDEDAIVAAESHGNVRLQDGKFYVSEDIDAEYDALRGFRFAV